MIAGCIEAAGDLSVTGCDIKSYVVRSQYLKADGSMELNVLDAAILKRIIGLL